MLVHELVFKHDALFGAADHLPEFGAFSFFPFFHNIHGLLFKDNKIRQMKKKR
jgi:hypothetical protein